MIKNLFFYILVVGALQGMQMEYEEGDHEEEMRMYAIASYFKQGDETHLQNFLQVNRSVDEQKKAVSHLLFVTVAGEAATPEFVTKLLNCGADPNTKDKEDEYSVLHNTLGYNNTDILVILLDHNGDVNSQNKRKTSLLHTALNYHKYEINYCEHVKLLIDRGAIVNKTVRNGFTPLRYAKDRKCDACIKILVEHGGVEEEEFR